MRQTEAIYAASVKSEMQMNRNSMQSESGVLYQNKEQTSSKPQSQPLMFYMKSINIHIDFYIKINTIYEMKIKFGFITPELISISSGD